MPDGLANGAAPGPSPNSDHAAEGESKAGQGTRGGAVVAQESGGISNPLPGKNGSGPEVGPLQLPNRGDAEQTRGVNAPPGANGFDMYGRIRAFAQAVGSGLGSTRSESGPATGSPNPVGLGLGPLGLESGAVALGNANGGIGEDPSRSHLGASNVTPAENGGGLGNDERRPDNTMTKLFSFLTTEALKLSPRTPGPVGASPVSGFPVQGLPVNGIPAASLSGTVRPSNTFGVEPTAARMQSHSQASDSGRAPQTGSLIDGVSTLSMSRPEPRFPGATGPVHTNAISGTSGAGEGGGNGPGASQPIPSASGRPIHVRSSQLDVRITPLDSPTSRGLGAAVPSSSNGPSLVNGSPLPAFTGAQTGTAAAVVQCQIAQILNAPIDKPTSSAVQNLVDAKPEGASLGAGEKSDVGPETQPSDTADDKSTVPKLPAANGNAKKKPGQVAGATRGRKKRRRAVPADGFTPPQKELAVYTVLTRGQAEQLREVKGGDRARLQVRRGIPEVVATYEENCMSFDSDVL